MVDAVDPHGKNGDLASLARPGNDQVDVQSMVTEIYIAAFLHLNAEEAAALAAAATYDGDAINRRE